MTWMIWGPPILGYLHESRLLHLLPFANQFVKFRKWGDPPSIFQPFRDSCDLQKIGSEKSDGLTPSKPRWLSEDWSLTDEICRISIDSILSLVTT